MNKIVTLTAAATKSRLARSQDKKVGLITGCFDILHEGHVDLFRFAKKHVDILIVALDSDQAIRQGKGENRPIHNISQRAKVLSELESVDFVLPIKEDYIFTKASVEPVHDKIRDAINPDYIITAPQADPYWQSKKARAERAGVKILLLPKIKSSSSSAIIKDLNLL